jgi:hypothetical protein
VTNQHNSRRRDFLRIPCTKLPDISPVQQARCIDGQHYQCPASLYVHNDPQKVRKVLSEIATRYFTAIQQLNLILVREPSQKLSQTN